MLKAQNIILTLILFISTSVTKSFSQGIITGFVADKENSKALSGIRVETKSSGRIIKGTYTKANGLYAVSLPEGKYSLKFSGIGRKQFDTTITIKNNETQQVNVHLEHETTKLENITVFGAARRVQKLTEAPAAISLVLPEDIQRGTAHGQLGKTLEQIQGVDVVQSGMNDFNINTRGFNNSINRRMLVLLDGRDPSTPLLNLVEWNSFQTDLADVKSLEVVRGPGSALYGANAYNGVINITTNSPLDVLGTRVSLTYGEHGTFRATFRHAETYNDHWSYKINAGYSRQNQDWVVSRQRDTTKPNDGLEYPGIAFDVSGNRQGLGYIFNIDSLINAHRTAFNVFGTFRIDYNINENERFLAETGFSKYGNEYFVNQTGRILIPDVQKPFARIAYNSQHWNIQTQWTNRYTPIPQTVLNAAASSAEYSNVFTSEAQWNDAFLEEKLKTVAGVSYEIQDVNTSVVGALPMLAPDDQHHNFTGIYGQFEYGLAHNLQLVGAARVDFSSYFNTQFSPKAAIVYSPIENQTFRITINRSFLRPSYADRFRRSPGGLPVNLATIDSAISAQTGAEKLGLGLTPVWNVGNPKVDVETAISYEIGYKGILSNEVFVTADAYINRRKNFISNPLGGLAPDIYKPLRYANSYANDSLKSRIGQLNYDRLAIYNDPVSGKLIPAFIITPTNIGLVEERGIELGINYYAMKQLLLSGNFAYLESDVIENSITTNKILPNTSPRRYNLSAQYVASNWDATASFHYVEGFQWIAGLFEGYVPSYGVLNINANYKIMSGLNLGINIFNALDNKHYEIFGGTYLYRYTTGTISYSF